MRQTEAHTRPHEAIMVPDDLFIDDPMGLSGPSLNTALLRQLRTAPGIPADDLNAAFSLVALLRAEYLAYGTDGATTLEDGTISELQRTARVVLQRLGVPLNLPWRNFTSFKSYWLAHDGYGSWHARRQMVAEVFDAAYGAAHHWLCQPTASSMGGTRATFVAR